MPISTSVTSLVLFFHSQIPFHFGGFVVLQLSLLWLSRGATWVSLHQLSSWRMVNRIIPYSIMWDCFRIFLTTFFYSTGLRLTSLLNCRIFLLEKHQILALYLPDPVLVWLNCPNSQLLWQVKFMFVRSLKVSCFNIWSCHTLLYQNILLETFWSQKTYKHLGFLLIN